jgi:hypothetical protein
MSAQSRATDRATIGGSMNKTCAVTDSADNAGCRSVCNDRLPVLDTAAQQKLDAGQPCKSDIGSSRHRPSETVTKPEAGRTTRCMWQLPRQFGRCRRRRGRTVAGPTRFPADLSAAAMPRTFHDRSFQIEVEPMSSLADSGSPSGVVQVCPFGEHPRGVWSIGQEPWRQLAPTRSRSHQEAAWPRQTDL